VRDRLYVGNAAAAYRGDILASYEISHILAIGDGLACPYPGEITYYQVQMTDHRTADLVPHLDSCVEWITEAVESGGRVLVHCQIGISRSPAI
jgi:hypothetical protein